MTNPPTSDPITLLPKRRAPPPGADARPNLYDFSPDDLVEEMKRQGLPVFRGKQILHWL